MNLTLVDGESFYARKSYWNLGKIYIPEVSQKRKWFISAGEGGGGGSVRLVGMGEL